MTDRTVKEIIAQARRPERTVALCLRGDLQAKWEDLDRQLKAVDPSSGSLEGDGRKQIAAEMEQLRDEMESSTLIVTIRALRHDKYQALKAQHPPRKPADPRAVTRAQADDDAEKLAEFEQQASVAEMDKTIGLNVSTFFPALIRECLVDPEIDGDDWEQLQAALTDRQFDDLAQAAAQVNQGAVDVPFSPTVSRLIRS